MIEEIRLQFLQGYAYLHLQTLVLLKGLKMWRSGVYWKNLRTKTMFTFLEQGGLLNCCAWGFGKGIKRHISNGICWGSQSLIFEQILRGAPPLGHVLLGLRIYFVLQPLLDDLDLLFSFHVSSSRAKPCDLSRILSFRREGNCLPIFKRVQAFVMYYWGCVTLCCLYCLAR